MEQREKKHYINTVGIWRTKTPLMSNSRTNALLAGEPKHTTSGIAINQANKSCAGDDVLKVGKQGIDGLEADTRKREDRLHKETNSEDGSTVGQYALDNAQYTSLGIRSGCESGVENSDSDWDLNEEIDDWVRWPGGSET
jgi:hypothetical protein